MSLLDSHAKHVIELQNRRYVDDDDGNRELVNVGPVIVQRASVQAAREWSVAEEQTDRGVTLQSIRRVFARDWPGDVNTLIYFMGDLFECVGDPSRYIMSRATRHTVSTARYIGTDPRPDYKTKPSYVDNLHLWEIPEDLHP